jgi:flavin-dependent dehydrogenase
LVGRSNDGWIVQQGNEQIALRPLFVIAADGAVSSVAVALGMARPEFLRGVLAEVPLTRSLDRTLVFLSPQIIGGYGWLFPKGKAANVGLGVVPRHDAHPRVFLEMLLEYLLVRDIIRPGVLARWGGLIPVSGLRERLVMDNVIFCGDAAGLTHPITGAGIPQAVVSGAAAGLAAARALKTGKRSPLSDYEEELRGYFGGVVDHARSKRELMMCLWDEAGFEDTCRQTWIGFKGYRKRVRRETTGT